MLGARTVAVVGASPRPDSFGERMVIESMRGSATVHLVNPRYRTIGERPCFPTLSDLDEPVDLVLLGVPDRALVEQLALAAQTGARSAVVFSSAHGPTLRQTITTTATEAGMALCGAGCMGFVNNAAGVRALGYLEPYPLAVGGISLITHSGSAFSTLLRSGRGLGFRVAVSSGQELVTDTADYLNYVLDDPETSLVGLLLETPRALPRLREALLRAAELGVAVVMLAVGGSPRGRAMVAAHSGALAGDDSGWAALCRATGAVRVTDLGEMADTLELFAARRRRRSGAHGIATVHDSGAERALCADVAHHLGVEFADLSEHTLATVAGLLDDGLAATNPLDLWGTGADTHTLFAGCLSAFASDPAVAVTALAVDLVSEFDGDTAYADAVVDVARAADAPLAVLASVPSAIDDETAKRLRDNGIPVLEGMRSGLAALGHYASWPLPVEHTRPVVDHQRRSAWLTRLRAGDTPGFDLLRDYGIPVPDSSSASSLASALAAAERIGYPVALKTFGAQHKSDVGGVALGLDDAAALEAAYSSMSAALGPHVTVDAMVAPGVEMSVGVVADPAFGPLLVVAAGGTLVELLVDRIVANPPVTHAGATAIVAGLRVARVLEGWRGAQACNVSALADVIVGFSQLAMELGEALEAVEANPVIVTPDGAVAVDVLVVPTDQKIE